MNYDFQAKSTRCLRKKVRGWHFSNSLRRITTSKQSLSKVYTLSSQRHHNLCKDEKIQRHINFSNKNLCYKLQIWCQTLFIANYNNSKEQVYIKIYNHSLSKATIVAASVIKSSTTLSNTRSTSDRRKSSEIKLGEALVHDD